MEVLEVKVAVAPAGVLPLVPLEDRPTVMPELPRAWPTEPPVAPL